MGDHQIFFQWWFSRPVGSLKSAPPSTRDFVKQTVGILIYNNIPSYSREEKNVFRRELVFWDFFFHVGAPLFIDYCADRGSRVLVPDQTQIEHIKFASDDLAQRMRRIINIMLWIENISVRTPLNRTAAAACLINNAYYHSLLNIYCTRSFG